MYGYELIKREYIDEIDSEVYLYTHTSGARLLYIKNNDTNRVVMPVFKTLPRNDRGEAHIVEHCTLCGSENYRLKDPFNVLEKGSLYTYLNAITYEDKTVYPVASTDAGELKKMAEVYADALFKPLFTEDEGIFRREGVCINKEGIGGVVYNEMKGAFSGEERCLLTALKKALYKGCAYEYCSAGIPGSIEELGYDELREFYREKYSPDNCLIYIYGDVDLEEYMGLYADYFTEGEKTDRDEEVRINDCKEVTEVPCGKDARQFSGVIFSCCRAESYAECIELSVLSDILTVGADSVLRKTLVDKGGAVNFSGGFDDVTALSEFYIIAEGMEASELKERLEEVFGKLIKEGIDKDKIKTSVDKLKFYISEGDFGYKPKGLFLGLELLKGLMYGDTSFQPLKIGEMLERAEKADYKALIEKYFIGKGVYGTTLAEDKKDEKSGKSFPLTGEFLPISDSRSELEKIPTKKIEDIPKDIRWFDPILEEGCIFTENRESNIVYLDVAYPLKESSVSAASLYGKTVLKLNEQLLKRVKSCFGRLNIGVKCIEVNGGSVPLLVFSTAFLRERFKECIAVFNDVVRTAAFEDNRALERIVLSLKAEYKSDFVSRGNTYGVGCVMSGLSYNGKLNDMAKGVGMYNYLNSKTDMLNEVKGVAEYIKASKPILVLRGTKEDREYICGNIPGAGAMPRVYGGEPNSIWGGSAYIIPSEVNFNCLGVQLPCFKGYMNVVRRIAESGYIWDKIRLEGGAYGGGCGFTRSGIMYMYSYRDPMLERTYAAFEGIGKYLSEFDADSSELNRFIVGAANEKLRPIKDKTVNSRILDLILQGRTYEGELAQWNELLDCTCDDIRRVGNMFQSVLDKAVRVSFCGDGEGAMKEFKNIYRL